MNGGYQSTASQRRGWPIVGPLLGQQKKRFGRAERTIEENKRKRNENARLKRKTELRAELTPKN